MNEHADFLRDLATRIRPADGTRVLGIAQSIAEYSDVERAYQERLDRQAAETARILAEKNRALDTAVHALRMLRTYSCTGHAAGVAKAALDEIGVP